MTLPAYPESWLKGVSTNPLETTFLEIGGGLHVPFGWGNIDPVHGDGALRRRAQEVPWPLEDNSVDRIIASHVMEHIPAGDDRLNVMNEMWRVLKPDGRALIIVPLLANENIGKIYYTAIADPTHVSFWMRSSFDYFTGVAIASADYGMKMWTELSWDTERYAWEGRWIGSPDK